MSIFRIAVYTLIMMIFYVHSAIASEEVNPQILSKVQHYYEINLAQNRGCNWFQVLTAFGHGPSKNPLGCSKEPYTSEQASSKPWVGWKPVRDELKRLEVIKAEAIKKSEQEEAARRLELENARAKENTAKKYPQVWIECKDTGPNESDTGPASCNVKTNKWSDANILVNSNTSIKYSVTDTTSIGRVESGQFIFKPTSTNATLGQVSIDWVNDDKIRLNSKVVLKVIPGDGYEAISRDNNYITIYEDDRTVYFSGADCYNGADFSATCYIQMEPPSKDTIDVKYKVTQSITKNGRTTSHILKAEETVEFGPDPNSKGRNATRGVTIEEDDLHRAETSSIIFELIDNPAPVGYTIDLHNPEGNKRKSKRTVLSSAEANALFPGVYKDGECSPDGKLLKEGEDIYLCLWRKNAYSSDIKVKVFITDNESTNSDLIPDEIEGPNNARTVIFPKNLHSTGVLTTFRVKRDDVSEVYIPLISLHSSPEDSRYTSSTKSFAVVNKPSIKIDYLHDPNVKQPEDNVGFEITVSPPGSETVGVYLGGYSKSKYVEVNIPQSGSKIVKFPVDEGDQIEIPLEVSFDIDTSKYDIDPISTRDHEVLVADDDPTVFKYIENTFNATLEEGSFTKISQISIAKPGTFNINHAKILIDFPLDTPGSGEDRCDLRKFDDGALTGKTSSNGDIPCRINIVHNRITRLGADKFELNGNIANGMTLQIESGEDNDTDNERIKFRPEITINSGGGVDASAIPAYIDIYDNDSDRGLYRR